MPASKYANVAINTSIPEIIPSCLATNRPETSSEGSIKAFVVGSLNA